MKYQVFSLQRRQTVIASESDQFPWRRLKPARASNTYLKHYSIVFDARADLTELCVRWACKTTLFPLGRLRTRGTFNELIMIFRHLIF